jgi:outer membrane lipoprotein-sorting protein
MKIGSSLRRQISMAGIACALLCGMGGLMEGNGVAAGQAQPGNNIHDYVVGKLDDFTANIHLVRYDANAGRRINKDFGTIYEFMKKATGDMKLTYKEADMLRVDGRFGPRSASYIVNNTDQWVRYPALGINTHADLGQSPGKRKTLLDVGLISDDYLSYTEAEYINNRPVDNVMCAVFRISYKDKNLDTSHRLVWVDPKTKVTLKREEYSQVGKLLSIWYYHNPQEVAPGIFMPESIEVDDSEGKLAGETAYRNIKVNQGVAESLFK